MIRLSIEKSSAGRYFDTLQPWLIKGKRSDNFTADERMTLVETMRDFISIIVTNDVTRIPKTIIEDWKTLPLQTSYSSRTVRILKGPLQPTSIKQLNKNIRRNISDRTRIKTVQDESRKSRKCNNMWLL